MLRFALGFALAALTAPAFAGECPHSKQASHHNSHTHHVAKQVTPAAPHQTTGADLVDTAVAAGQFKTLVAAAQAAGLVDALKGEGPLTVFAPTDEAFAKIPAETIQSLLQPENKDQLVKILTYHVVPGRVLAQDVVSLRSAKTLQGGEVAIGVAGGRVFVNNAQVLKTDIETTNGVIHVIDTVIMPAE
ncbi:Immunogenic protein MPT70 precursor [Planctomycetes bacterium MalM25]|nr:Immunogenic protein MPT70 precursor [Planctomycetes bacterium MalM25]